MAVHLMLLGHMCCFYEAECEEFLTRARAAHQLQGQRACGAAAGKVAVASASGREMQQPQQQGGMSLSISACGAAAGEVAVASASGLTGASEPCTAEGGIAPVCFFQWLTWAMLVCKRTVKSWVPQCQARKDAADKLVHKKRRCKPGPAACIKRSEPDKETGAEAMESDDLPIEGKHKQRAGSGWSRGSGGSSSGSGYDNYMQQQEEERALQVLAQQYLDGLMQALAQQTWMASCRRSQMSLATQQFCCRSCTSRAAHMNAFHLDDQ
eukprot:scaffold152167_cov20-Tisochrysis_lutea.AAC.2